jgi:hypothetical protein
MPCLIGMAEEGGAGRQAFTVRVAPSMTVSAPAPEITTAYDGTTAEATFPAQSWFVDANAQAGATVSFTTDRAFTHTKRAEFKRDALLELVIPQAERAAKWAVAVGSDRTHYAAGGAGETATVRAVSEGPGQGTFDITVTFLEDPGDAIEPGDYSLTLVGTVTAN